jgi:hypothetical protein
MKTREELVQTKYDLLQDLKEAKRDLKLSKTAFERHKFHKEIHEIGMLMLETDSELARINALVQKERFSDFPQICLDMLKDKYPDIYKEVSAKARSLMEEE